MTKREIAVTRAKSAGYHDDAREITRLFIESRVRRELLNEAWHQGKRMKAAGMTCDCYQCKS